MCSSAIVFYLAFWGPILNGTFFVFAFFPVDMVGLLVVLGRIQRGLPADADGALRVPVPAVR